MDWRILATVAHVLAAFWFVAGYVGTNVLTEIARRATTHQARVAALALSDQFDRWLYQRGGTAVLLTGAVAGWVRLPPHHALDHCLDRADSGNRARNGAHCRGYGQRVNEAIAAGDAAATGAILTDPKAVLLSRLENLAVLAIIVLMVLRPG